MTDTDEKDKNKVEQSASEPIVQPTTDSLPTDTNAPTPATTQQYAGGLLDYLDTLQKERDRLNASYNEEEERKERKRQYRNNLIASIGDGISALARIGAAKGYAPTPNVKTATPLSDAYTKRYDDYLARRAKAKDVYDKAMLNLNNRDYTARKALIDLAQKDRNLQSLINRRNAQNENDRTKSNAYVKTQETQQGLNEARKVTEEGKPAVQKSQIELNQKRGNAATTTAAASVIRANKAGSGKGSGGKGGGKGSTPKYPVFNKDGDVVSHVYTRDEAVSETERIGGTYPKTETSGTVVDGTTGQVKRVKNTRVYSAGRQVRQQPKPQPKPTEHKKKKVVKGFNGH